MLDKINDSLCIRCLKSQKWESYGVYGDLGEAGDGNLLRIMRQKKRKWYTVETGGELRDLETCCGSLLRWEEGLTPDSKQSMEEEEFLAPAVRKSIRVWSWLRKGCFPKAQQRGERHFFFFKAAMHFLFSPVCKAKDRFFPFVQGKQLL